MIELSPATALLGQFQRGRGSGFLAALARPSADVWPLLAECVTNDPCCDRQTEPREAYYADLILQTGMDLAPLAHHMRGNDDPDEHTWNTGLTVSTLAALARRGYPSALPIVREYVTWGFAWEHALWELGRLGDPAAFAGLDTVVLDRFPTDEALAEGLRNTHDDTEPWKSWCALHPRIDRVYRHRREECDAEREKRPRGPSYAALSLPEIFAHVSDRNYSELARFLQKQVRPSDLSLLLGHLAADVGVIADWREPRALRRGLVLTGLEELADSAAWPALKALVEARPEGDHRLCVKVRGAVVALPAGLVLETGRAWFDSGIEGRRWLGLQILKEHATPDDVSRLRRAVAGFLTCADCYLLWTVTQTLGRLSAVEALPELEQAFAETPHAWIRLQVARALHSLAPARFAKGLAFECLWDCEEGARAFACAAVDLTMPGARARVHELAESPFEEDEVRRAAAGRLAGDGGTAGEAL